MKRHLTRRRITIALVAVLAVLAFVVARRPAAVDVETAVVERAPLEVTIDEDGRTRAVDRYVVTAPVSGSMQRVDLREGAALTRGDVIARIEPLPLDAPTETGLRAGLAAAEARRSAAIAARDQALAGREQAVRELERRRDLREQGALSAELLEQYALSVRLRVDDFAVAEQQVRAAEADVNAARAALLATAGGAGARPSAAVRAPADGVLLRVPERSARIVSAGTPVAEIGDPTAIEVVVDVLTTDAVRVRPGMRALLRNWGGEPLGATVRVIEPSAFTRVSALGVEEQRVNVILALDERPAELGDGYRVDAAIVVWSAADVLSVPSSALFREEGGWALFVVEDGRARQRTVQIGERGGARAQVLGGVSQGAVVVLFPSDRLSEGQRVRAQR
jgi:HlyD family secretion protein